MHTVVEKMTGLEMAAVSEYLFDSFWRTTDGRQQPFLALLANDGEVLDQCRTATRRMRKMNSHTQRTPRIRRGRKENRWIFLLSASSAKSLRPLRSEVGGFQ
jgi:hypothetical protein